MISESHVAGLSFPCAGRPCGLGNAFYHRRVGFCDIQIEQTLLSQAGRTPTDLEALLDVWELGNVTGNTANEQLGRHCHAGSSESPEAPAITQQSVAGALQRFPGRCASEVMGRTGLGALQASLAPSKRTLLPSRAWRLAVRPGDASHACVDACVRAGVNTRYTHAWRHEHRRTRTDRRGALGFSCLWLEEF